MKSFSDICKDFFSTNNCNDLLGQLQTLDKIGRETIGDYYAVGCEIILNGMNTGNKYFNLAEMIESYFNYDNVNKVITLKNNFTKRQTGGKAKFIILTDREIDFLLIHKSELLTRYYLYIKYYCGFSGKNETDFTANQFLEASKYSTKAGNYKTLLSSYNSLLVNEKLITISKFRFNGQERNKYSIL